MTLTMADSIYPADLPAGYDAYAGYVDGRWPTYPGLQKLFPAAHVLSIAVFASGDAEALDIETGDAVPLQAPGWVARQQARGVTRPVLYASAVTMPAVLAALTAAGIPRGGVRLWSAHYGAGEHICGPGTCKLVPVAMDGTQWTDAAAGVGGAQVDASVLAGDFFEEGPMFVVIPGVPGKWLTFTQYTGADGTQVVVGLGTEGDVYITRKPASGTWSTPAKA